MTPNTTSGPWRCFAFGRRCLFEMGYFRVARYPAVRSVGHSDPRIGLSTKSLAEKRLDYSRFSDHASVIPIARYQQIYIMARASRVSYPNLLL